MAGALPIGEPWPATNKITPSSWWQPSTSHAYVHVPFCRVRCGYCDFNTYTADELRGATRDGFHISICEEIEFSGRVLSESEVKLAPLASIFFGGGTPTLFSTDQFARILEKLAQVHGIASGAEITVEANPDTVDFEYLRRLKDLGINRISFGVQSFDPGVLLTLDRSHDPTSVPKVVADAKRAGLDVSIDLIYGTPGESLDSWRETLLRAIELDTDHISAYSLIVETGTKLANRVRRGELPDIDPDFHADCYELATGLLARAGFSWYEVSNWARSEPHRSTHNLAYWQSRDWWGYGPGAHSHIAGTRWWNVKHPAAYEKALGSGAPIAAGLERLSRRQMLEERLLLELRTVSGAELQVLRELGTTPKRIAQELADGNLRLLPNGRISVTDSGRLVADAIVLRLLDSE